MNNKEVHHLPSAVYNYNSIPYIYLYTIYDVLNMKNWIDLLSWLFLSAIQSNELVVLSFGSLSLVHLWVWRSKYRPGTAAPWVPVNKQQNFFEGNGGLSTGLFYSFDPLESLPPPASHLNANQ